MEILRIISIDGNRFTNLHCSVSELTQKSIRIYLYKCKTVAFYLSIVAISNMFALLCIFISQLYSIPKHKSNFIINKHTTAPYVQNTHLGLQTNDPVCVLCANSHFARDRVKTHIDLWVRISLVHVIRLAGSKYRAYWIVGHTSKRGSPIYKLVRWALKCVDIIND